MMIMPLFPPRPEIREVPNGYQVDCDAHAFHFSAPSARVVAEVLEQHEQDAGHHDPHHLAFGEFEPDDQTAIPCGCWYAGYENVPGDHPRTYIHPSEWVAGRQAAYEHEYDL